ncbi:PLP-dependent aminotransferase family protein [Roseomonas sp. M0104]|uniref:PLP-dependent aminotransferase family protein n=1 Tax=Teichococcus coralli TaxID=2545983 RepID=A0A845BC23_9PROT|nr:PLP-dependent aminotransferase family protein [Pseudoroseomonas coralli]MXP64405.1 PLP-dependent aminotransferase family protein [Pseudoroseomonas coralli]
MPTTSLTAPDLPLLLDGSGGNQSSRLHAGLRAAILGGRLPAGLRLPSSRALAAQLGLRRNAVIAAYEQLLSDGLAESRTGAGTFVAPRLPQGHAPGPVEAAPRPTLPPPAAQAPFAIGRTQPDQALLDQLGRLIRRQLAQADPAHFGYGDPRGGEPLRAAIAAHLAATRGILCDPGHVLVTSGTRHGLHLCAATLLRPGDAAWMEDPGYPSARQILEAAGARLVPVPVDGAGLDAAEGRRRALAARLAYVTPSHQFPTGVTMSMPRRLALLEWAQEADAWVLEDDYDSEFRYAGPPLTALAGIDRQARVIYLGTFSKTLFPGLRIGYLVLPPALLPAITTARAAVDRFPPSPLSGALAELVSGGGFAAHVRRMRGRYRAARDRVAETLTRTSEGALRVAVPDQGLHLLALLPDGLPPGAARAIRAAAGVEGWLLSDTRIIPKEPDGFVLGFSGHPLPALERAAERLGRAARNFARA